LVCYCLGFGCPLCVLVSGDIVLSVGLANHGISSSVGHVCFIV
ncbi:unnamed protein product, partial [Brassica oleracea var. botrytis]